MNLYGAYNYVSLKRLYRASQKSSSSLPPKKKLSATFSLPMNVSYVNENYFGYCIAQPESVSAKFSRRRGRSPPNHFLHGWLGQ